jgi:predicted transcriptional regulator
MATPHPLLTVYTLSPIFTVDWKPFKKVYRMDIPSIHRMVLKFQAYSGGGPTPKFSLFHVWKTYNIINEQGPIGRKALAQTLGIGEGSTRTILDKMMREGSVENTKMGAILTDRGLKQFRNSGITAAPVKIDGLTISSQDCAVLVKGMADRISTGYDQRDEAVRAGAVGATTLVFKNGKLIFPGDAVEPDQVKLAPIRSAFSIEENDVVIVGTANSYEIAEKGAVTAALSLGDQSRPSWRDGTPGGLVNAETEAEDLRALALAVHELVGRLPVTMRTKNNYGVRCEDGEVIDTNFTGPVLEESLKKGIVVRKNSPSGPYRGVPVVVVPIMRRNEAVAVFGVVDITKDGMFEIMSRSRKEI